MSDDEKTREQLIEELRRLRAEAAGERTSIGISARDLQADLLSSVEQAVIATDLQGTILYLNAFAERLYQWTRERYLMKHWKRPQTCRPVMCGIFPANSPLMSRTLRCTTRRTR